jgi:hypothetical protein
MQNVKFHVIDLTKVKGKGDFRCPKCEIRISPDDKKPNPPDRIQCLKPDKIVRVSILPVCLKDKHRKCFIPSIT